MGSYGYTLAYVCGPGEGKRAVGRRVEMSRLIASQTENVHQTVFTSTTTTKGAESR